MKRTLKLAAIVSLAMFASGSGLRAQPVLAPPGAPATRPAADAAPAETVYVIRRDPAGPEAAPAEDAPANETIEGRHKALEQHRLGDQAYRLGQTQEALVYYAPLTTNPYMTPQERQQIARLCEQLERKDAARRAAALQGVRPDRPNGARPDADQLLAEARQAFAMKNFERAELLANQAQQLGHTTFFPWSDTPAKLLRDVHDARRQLVPTASANNARPGAMQIVQAPRTQEPVQQSTPSGRFSEPARFNEAAPRPTEQSARAVVRQGVDPAAQRSVAARGLLEQAHQHVEAGDLLRAKQLLGEAEALKAGIPWWEDFTPEKIRLEITRAEQGAKTRPMQATAVARTTPPAARPTPPSNDISPLPAKPGAYGPPTRPVEVTEKRPALARTPLPPLLDPVKQDAAVATKPVPPAQKQAVEPTPWRLLEPRKPESEIIARSPPLAGLGGTSKSNTTAARPSEDPQDAATQNVDNRASQFVAQTRRRQMDGLLLEALAAWQLAKHSHTTPGPQDDVSDELLSRLYAELQCDAQAQLAAFSAAVQTLTNKGHYRDAERYQRCLQALAAAFEIDLAKHAEPIPQSPRYDPTVQQASGFDSLPGDLRAESGDSARKAQAQYEQGAQAFAQRDYAGAACYLQGLDPRLLHDQAKDHVREMLGSKEMVHRTQSQTQSTAPVNVTVIVTAPGTEPVVVNSDGVKHGVVKPAR